jgi:aminoglycoside phosphotransferase (APT) family kinase protein
MTSTAQGAPAVIRIEALLDVARMAATLADSIDTGFGPLTSAQLLDHKPGRRALIAYRSQGAELYGKAYADPVAAARSFDLMRRCHEVFADAAGLRVPQPLALVADLATVLYRPLPGDSLDDLITTTAMTSGLDAAAHWLAVLHEADLHFDRTLDVPHEAANAAEWAAVVAHSLPEATTRASRLAQRLLAEPVPPIARAVPIHKDFHYQHVIVEESDDGVGVVDLDEARMGHPSFDLAHFTVNLHLLALRTGTAQTDADGWLCSFLGAYGAATGWSVDDAFRWFAAYTCIKVARQLATGAGPRPRPSGAARAGQVDAILGEGLACLGD